MKSIILLPIEPLDMRYSTQWKKWFIEEINNDGRFTLTVIDPEPLTTEITSGAFLDVCGTNFYKSKQLQELCQMMQLGLIDDETTVLCLDGWFPGIEMLAYMRDFLKINFKITACFHAGTYCPEDITSKVGMTEWAYDLENSWFKIYDQIFVASYYHKSLISSGRTCIPTKIKVTGFPMYLEPISNLKEKIVVFPHRLSEDKQPELFDKLHSDLSDKYPDWQFIKTQEKKRTKQEYYELLSKSAIAVSFAKHELWGIAMQEAVFYGCVPIVPNRVAYAEMYPFSFKYEKYKGCLNKVMHYIETINAVIDDPNGECSSLEDFNDMIEFSTELKALSDRFCLKNRRAISSILEELI